MRRRPYLLALLLTLVVSCHPLSTQPWHGKPQPYEWWQKYFSDNYPSFQTNSVEKANVAQTSCIVALVYRFPRFAGAWVVCKESDQDARGLPQVGTSQFVLRSDQAVAFLVGAEACSVEDAGLFLMMFDARGGLLAACRT